VFRYLRPARLSLKEEKARQRERIAHEEQTINYLWQTFPCASSPSRTEEQVQERKRELYVPLRRIAPTFRPERR